MVGGWWLGGGAGSNYMGWCHVCPPAPTHISSIYLLSPTKPGGILVNHHVERKTGQQYFATNNKLMKANTLSIKNDKRPVELFINDFHNLRNCAVCKRKALQRRFKNSVKLLLSDLRQKQKHNIILSLRERGVVCVYYWCDHTHDNHHNDNQNRQNHHNDQGLHHHHHHHHLNPPLQEGAVFSPMPVCVYSRRSPGKW